MKKGKGKKILAILMAALMVVGIMPMDWAAGIVANAATTFTGGEKVTSGEWKDWTWSTFGNSTSETKNPAPTVNKDESVEIKSTGGKIAGSNDGISYLYYELNKNQDFILSATLNLTSWTGAKQNAFGLMLRDEVGTHDSSAEASPLSSAFVGGNANSDQSDYYKGWLRKASGTEKIGSNTDGFTVGQVMDLCIQKVGDNLYFVEDGELVATGSIDDFIADDDMYVGLFTARATTAVFSNVSLNYITSESAVAVDSKTNPSKTTYIMGNDYSAIDLAGFSANVTVGGTAKTITDADCRIKSFDFSAAPGAESVERNIVLDYFGTEISIPITVIKEKVTDITVNYNPIKTDYFLNETIDWTGLDATVTYNSGVTKQLKDLIDTSDSETEVVHDFTVAGTTSIVVKHTHGDVTKQVSIPVTVSDAEVTSIDIVGPNQTVFYKGIDKNAEYKTGLLVEAQYSDGSEKVLSDGFTVEAKTTALDCSTVGEYTYVVTYGGKTKEYTLSVINRTVKELEIATYPTTTTFVKDTAFDKAGLKINAVYDSGEKEEVTDYVVDSSAYDKTSVGEYTIKVNATVDGKALNTSFVVAVRDRVEYKYDDLTWGATSFGQSTSDGIVPTMKDGVITVESKAGVGKCTDDGQDGIAYYYTVLNPTADNFEITAKVKVDYFITKSSPDNQEGFGIMVRDSIGTNGDSSIYYSNAMSVGGYYGRYNVFGRYGVSSSTDGAGKVNYTYNGNKPGNLNYQIKDTAKTFTLTLKKDNTGVYATMLDENGTALEGIDGSTVWYLPANTFSSIEDDKLYIGFMTARGAKIEINTSDISMKVTSAAADAPQTFASETAVTPSVSLASLTETADESYNIIAKVNTKGLLTVKQNGETLKSQMSVEAGSYSIPTSLLLGDNKVQLYFEPDATQNIDSATAVYSNNTVIRKMYATTEDPIYVSVTGTKDGKGTKESPLDIQTAISYCLQGQAIYVMEGTYDLSKSTGVWKGNDGTEKKMKQLVACPDNKGDVIFDFADSKDKATSYTFDFSGDYWYVKGIKFINGGGVRVGGNHNILELCEFNGHTNSGLSISRTDSATEKKDWPSYNQILNCAAYSNRDKSDNNADGFAAKLTCGDGNVFKGCVAAYNADDGWDLFSKGGTGAIGEVKIYDSVCYANGYAIDEATGAITATKGDGNGFKLGGSGIAVNHQIYNSYSFGNKTNGFTNNSDPLGTYVGCVGYNNGGSNLELHTYTGVDAGFTVEGFKSYADGLYTTVKGLTATEKESKKECIEKYISDSNFFYDFQTKGVSVNKSGVQLLGENFENLSDFTKYVTGTKIPRDSNGNLVMGSFLKYVANVENTVTVDKVDESNAIVSAEIDENAVVKDANGNVVPLDQVVIHLTPATTENESAMKNAITEAGITVADTSKLVCYDIKLNDKSGNVLTLSNGKVRITFAKDDTIDYSKYDVVVYHVKEDGTFEALTTTITDKGIEVVTEGFSTFAVLTSEKVTAAPDGTETGDTTNALPFVFMLFGCVALAAGVYFFDKKRKTVGRR